MKKNDIRLYNVLFPIWFLFLFPQLWLIMLPVNFLVDSLVVFLSALRQKLEHPFTLWRKSILPVWIIGFVSDLIGAGLTVLLSYGFGMLSRLGIETPNLILFPGTTLISIPGLILAGILIYLLNLKFSFKESGLEPQQILKLCLHLALWTAPYTMLIPIYG